MKKVRKPRAVYATVQEIRGYCNSYYLVTPYDKRGKEIPSSVNCAYNSHYYSYNSALRMAEAL
jgi:hypothetical protein